VSVCSSGDTLVRKGAIGSCDKRQPQLREASGQRRAPAPLGRVTSPSPRHHFEPPVNCELPHFRDGEKYASPISPSSTRLLDRNRYRGRDWPDLVGRRDVRIGPRGRLGNGLLRLTQPDAQQTATRSLVGAGDVLIRTLWMLITRPLSITRTRIWRKILEFVRLPLPLFPVWRGRFFDRNIWPDFRIFRIQ